MARLARHSERCRECKIRVEQLLQALYGECMRGYRFDWSTELSSYIGTPVHALLESVLTAIEAHRGYRISDFVRTPRLASCDFWLPDPGFVVEFDESQHFTAQRKSALSVYTSHLPLGFSGTRWMELCDRHHASDNDPPYRDEQRAWYDTLRDLAPIVHGHSPTVRLYASDLAWCTLDPTKTTDLRRFTAVGLQNVTCGQPAQPT